MEEKLVYKNKSSKQDRSRVVTAVVAPALVFLVVIGIINAFGVFGQRLIAPLASLMWLVGVVVAIMMPSHRPTVLKETLVTLTTYVVTLYLLRRLLIMVSGVSSEMLAASFDQSIVLATSNVIPNFIQTALWMTSVGIPLGFFGMQLKRLLEFRKRNNKAKVFDQLRSIRNNGQTPYQ